MKLLLKREAVTGLFALFDESGEMLPSQLKVELISEPGELQMLHVSFYCDGEFIKVVGDGNGTATD